MRNILKIHVLLIVCLIVSSQFAFAEGIKDRMKNRLPAIADLKTKGIIGEDNSGYLGFVTGARAQEDVIAAENADRKAVYEHFAKQQNTTVDVVEKVQAARKMEKANPGEFFQNPDGSWQKK
ncbi:MAG: YdbL family protein [Proteobacteria bacterium]|nr:YdbL family protein [Pseudomonadota bacterium]MBU1585887.1 YdbL family protein [Pseudomonadota bacterium]MBU2452939.1 YdbL family protein [Pseudomonadota bacterium]MBU2627956.1 YdbL family protein [Pseudomonadota bacterium]